MERRIEPADVRRRAYGLDAAERCVWRYSAVQDAAAALDGCPTMFQYETIARRVWALRNEVG